MIAFWLMFVAGLADEVGTAINKHETQIKKDGLYTIGLALLII